MSSWTSGRNGTFGITSGAEDSGNSAERCLEKESLSNEVPEEDFVGDMAMTPDLERRERRKK